MDPEYCTGSVILIFEKCSNFRDTLILQIKKGLRKKDSDTLDKKGLRKKRTYKKGLRKRLYSKRLDKIDSL